MQSWVYFREGWTLILSPLNIQTFVEFCLLLSSLSLHPFHTSLHLLNMLTSNERKHAWSAKITACFSEEPTLVCSVILLESHSQVLYLFKYQKTSICAQNELVNKTWWKNLRVPNAPFIMCGMWQIYNNSVSLKQQRSHTKPFPKRDDNKYIILKIHIFLYILFKKMTSKYEKMILYVTKLPSTVLAHPVHNSISSRLAFYNE